MQRIKRMLLFNTQWMPVIAVALTGIFFTFCRRDKGQLPVAACNSPATVSFSKDLLPLFQANCAVSGCHVGSNPTGNLNLESGVAYTNLMKHGSGYIDTLHPNYSLLYAQMISASDPMPPSGKLDNCKTGLILTWIGQKAKNN